MSLDELLEGWGLKDGSLPEFRPCVIHNPAMDWLTVQIQDATRSIPLMPNVIDLLLDPHSDRIVGIRIWDVDRIPGGRKLLDAHKLAAPIP